jgi:spermidine/putrescine transport system substrate-binding protein
VEPEDLAEEGKMRHPREGAFGRRMGRREFLRRTAGTAFAISGAGALLAACREREISPDPGAAQSPGGQVVRFDARSDNPVTLPIFDDNPPIEDGLDPEGGPLQVYNWIDYLWKKLLKEFGEDFGVDWTYTIFHNTEIAVEKLAAGDVDFDVFFPTPDLLPKLVQSGLIQPLNLSYIPNLANVWTKLQDPYYDQGSHYSVPYGIYTTGIGYRSDLVSEDIGARENPYEVFWDPMYEGKIGIYDDYREAISMVLLKNGITDLNTDNPDHIELVQNDLLAMIDATNIRPTINGAYIGIPESRFAVHQAWSGDMAYAPYYMPADEYGDPNGVLRYWRPLDGRGVVGNDLMAIPKSAKNPVLAHHFLNFMLDNSNGVRNFTAGWGYQPPLSVVDPDELVGEGAVPPNLKSAIVRQDDFGQGFTYDSLQPEVEAMYVDAWTTFKAGV